MSFKKRFIDFVSDKNLLLLMIIISLISIVRTGGINTFIDRLVLIDHSTSGPFSAYLILKPEIYSDDLVRFLTPIGYFNPLVLNQVFLRSFFGIDPMWTSYFQTLLGNLFYCLGFFFFVQVLIRNRAISMLIVLGGYLMKVDVMNPPIMGNASFYPATTGWAAGLFLLIFTALYKDKIFYVTIFFCLLAFFHASHALLILFIVALHTIVSYVTGEIDLKKLATKLAWLIIPGLICLVPYFVMTYGIDSKITGIHLMDLYRGLDGHSNPWLHPHFLSYLSSFTGCIALFVISYRHYHLLSKSFWTLFFCVVTGAMLFSLLQIIANVFYLPSLVLFPQIISLRSTTYITYFTFPIVAYFLGHKALDPDEQPITRVAVLILGLLSIGYSSLGFWVIILFLAFSEYHSSEIDSSINIKQRQRSILIVSMLFILTILPILFLYEFSDIGKNLSAVIMPNIMGHYGVSQTTAKLLPLISIVFLFCRRIWVNILIIGLLIVGLVFVMSHESQDPVLFQRYSYKAFTAIVIYLIMLFTALLTTIFFNRTHSFISRRLPSRKSIGIIVSQEINRFFDIFSGLTLILDKTRLLIPGRSPLEQRIGIIVVALFALLGLFNTIDINRQARSRDATEMAVWMNQNTPLDSKFLTAEEFLQHNSVSLRPTIVPRPYLVTGYRTLDSRSQDFDEQMLTYWSIDRSEIPKLGWLENAHDDIKDRFYKLNEREILRLAHRFNANYYINRVEKRPLMFDQAYKNSSFIVYSLPELSE